MVRERYNRFFEWNHERERDQYCRYCCKEGKFDQVDKSQDLKSDETCKSEYSFDYVTSHCRCRRDRTFEYKKSENVECVRIKEKTQKWHQKSEDPPKIPSIRAYSHVRFVSRISAHLWLCKHMLSIRIALDFIRARGVLHSSIANQEFANMLKHVQRWPAVRWEFKFSYNDRLRFVFTLVSLPHYRKLHSRHSALRETVALRANHHFQLKCGPSTTTKRFTWSVFIFAMCAPTISRVPKILTCIVPKSMQMTAFKCQFQWRNGLFPQNSNWPGNSIKNDALIVSAILRVSRISSNIFERYMVLKCIFVWNANKDIWIQDHWELTRA